MFELDLRSRIPIYEQLVERIKEMIITELLKSDEQLPSVRSLAQQLTINPNTIQKAYRELEKQGYVYTVQGRGNFVSPVMEKMQKEKKEELRRELKKLMAEAFYLGMDQKDMHQMIDEVMEQQGGGEKND
ncbi:GntR family transcriptional regulator [Tindallia californiensis]|uniref:GntR family transcriptional regulator n=1 Tax=Tindallia californiensis TaxID=159292 RepID=A0A1H3P9X7_9FIRM|nr:GntR family transcriptional regulator [Tindallia californiensis]SDY97887.1 GntR family transcriptional regulator [Tindallia californiensis]